MQFKEGTTVQTADGQKVGTIERFVLDPRARQIAGLIVRKGFLFVEDKVIPASAVATADAEKVTLNKDTGDPQDFPPFEEKHYITPDAAELEGYPQNFYGALYYYPPMAGSTSAYGPVFPIPFPTRVTRNIPEETVPLEESGQPGWQAHWRRGASLHR